jgi:hypothetical protein
MPATDRHLFDDPRPSETGVRHIPVSEFESVRLLEQSARRGSVSLAFGTGGVALIWDLTRPMPWSVRALGLMRGILNENTEGLGI